MKFSLKKFLFLFQTSITILCHVVAFYQNDCHLIRERVQLYYFNPKFVRNAKIEYRFFNRTTKAFYGQWLLLEDTDNDVEMQLDAYKLYSNEYRGFPITIKLNACKELDKTAFGFDDVKTISNLTNCPWKRGFYVVKNYIPDETKFPPFIPHGRYKGIAKVTYHSELVLEIHVYSEVKGIMKVGDKRVYV